MTSDVRLTGQVERGGSGNGEDSAVDDSPPAGTEAEAEAGPGPEVGAEADVPRLRRFGRRVDLPGLAQLLAVVPVLAMASEVRRASKLQWFDYWALFPASLNPDGSLAPRTLFDYHEGHIVAIPRVVYWLNYKLTSGLNTTLALFVLALVVAQLLLLRHLLPDRRSIGPWARATLVVAGAALLFSPQGIHNFARAMSGTAWLLANFFAVVALVIASRGPLGRSLLLAVPFAVCASLSYGSGLMTWPALVVVAALRRRWGAVHTVATVVAAVAVGTYFLFYDRPASQSSVGLDLSDIGRRTAQVLGSVLSTSPDTTVIVGVVAVGLAGFVVARAVQADLEAVAPWVGLLLYALLAAGMIGMARGGVNGDDIGTSSRYFSLSALFLFALLVLVAVGWARDPRVLLVSAVVGGLAFVGGQVSVVSVRETNYTQDELAIAMRLGVSQNYPFFFGYDRYRPQLEQWGHYPFSDAYDLDCGRSGETVEIDARITDLDGARGAVDDRLQSRNVASVRYSGWMGVPGHTVDCVLVIDENLTVVGAGTYGIERPDVVRSGGSPTGSYDVGFLAVARAGSASYQVVAQLDDGRLVALPGRAEQAPGQDGGSRDGDGSAATTGDAASSQDEASETP